MSAEEKRASPKLPGGDTANRSFCASCVRNQSSRDAVIGDLLQRFNCRANRQGDVDQVRAAYPGANIRCRFPAPSALRDAAKHIRPVASNQGNVRVSTLECEAK